METQFRKVDARSYAWMHGHSKRCPQCKIPIQRQSGCNMMVCSMCDTHFCWNCDAILGRNPYKHFNNSPDCRGEGPQIPLD
ncbi:RBR-type E3 ubiquitin transferase [Trichostrongylus colubriformis]|uniref:RBR-type E3 ubiquitin transferase n=1 Tax=Trichostrongylus colubriformis TaxID=6319 RepID=A0AAN8ITQ1_TRICO